MKKAAMLVAGALAAVLLAPATEAQAAPSLAQRALSVAKAQKGDPYAWGAAGPDRFDCSGLVHYSFRKAGYKWPYRMTAQGQYNRSRHISPSSRRPGDPVFIGRSSRTIYHAGIYAGKWKDKYGVVRGWMWDAPKPGRRVGLHQIRYYTAGAPRAYYGRL